jgi:hypothetical protein
MTPEEEERYGGDLRNSPPPRSRSSRRTPGDDEFPPDGRLVRENGERHREVRSLYYCTTCRVSVMRRGSMFN